MESRWPAKRSDEMWVRNVFMFYNRVYLYTVYVWAHL